MGCEGGPSLVIPPDPPGEKVGSNPMARRVRDQGATQAFQKAFAAASPASVPHSLCCWRGERRAHVSEELQQELAVTTHQRSE